MASFVGALTEWNPYIQQIPTEAYMKVGMFKQQQYEAGFARVQESIDKIAGLDVANEGGRKYLQARVDELTNSLNKYSAIDFSNPNNVAQLASLGKPLYQDENIVNDVVNTGIYRKWSKEATDAYKSGKMELGQFMRETTDANQWLTSDAAGTKYSGRQTPNTATKKELLDRIVKYKKDAMDQNEIVYDTKYSHDTPWYVKSTNKYYSEADFNNFVANNVMSNSDREMLMNDHWYENMGKPTEQLQLEDIALYSAKIEENNAEIDRIKNLPNNYSGEAKMGFQKNVDELTAYNKQLKDGKIAYLKSLNLNDPTTRDLFHRDLAESRFVNSLDILRDEVRKEELQKNDYFFEQFKMQMELAKEAMKAKAAAGTTPKAKAPLELIDEVAVITPVDSNAPKTQLSLGTIKQGYDLANNRIISSELGLIGKFIENGIDMGQFMRKDDSGNLMWDRTQVGDKAGATMNIPVWKSEEDRDRFYNLVHGLNYAFNKEALDGNMDNKSFINYVKANIAGYVDEDPNSEFTMTDKRISDALNSIKGTSALLPRLDKLFTDKTTVRALSNMDAALKDKYDMANSYRAALLQAPGLSTEEVRKIKATSDDNLLGRQSVIDINNIKDRETERDGFREWGEVGVIEESDGTFSIGDKFLPIIDGRKTEGQDQLSPWRKARGTIAPPPRYENKYMTGFKTKEEAEQALKDGDRIGNKIILKGIDGISNDTFLKADEHVRRTYSYVQQVANSTVQNLKDNKAAYAAVQDGLTLFLNKSRNQVTPQDLSIEGGTIDPRGLSGISKVEVLGAAIANSENIFDPNATYEIQFEAVTGQGTKDEKKSTYNATVSLRSFLATNPNFNTSEYARYFAPILYAREDAYAMIKSRVNPLEGSQASYADRDNIEPVYQRETRSGELEFASDRNTDIAWTTFPVERGGEQTMISYQVVSMGEDTVLGNAKNREGDKINYAPGKYYVKFRIPGSDGKPKTIVFKTRGGESRPFNSASYAHHAVRDLIFNNPNLELDEIDERTGQPNFFTLNENTIRGIMNSQLIYNGYPGLETIKIKDALGKEEQKQQIKGLHFGRAE